MRNAIKETVYGNASYQPFVLQAYRECLQASGQDRRILWQKGFQQIEAPFWSLGPVWEIELSSGETFVSLPWESWYGYAHEENKRLFSAGNYGAHWAQIAGAEPGARLWEDLSYTSPRHFSTQDLAALHSAMDSSRGEHTQSVMVAGWQVGVPTRTFCQGCPQWRGELRAPNGRTFIYAQSSGHGYKTGFYVGVPFILGIPGYNFPQVIEIGALY